MGEAVEKFVTEFHNLPGTTIKEKQKNLFGLLRQQSSLSPEELDDLIKNLKPINYLEKIFHVDVLIHFRRFNELYKKYLHGDDITVSKLSKQDWFYQKAFKDISPEDFVNRFLSTISYALKAKVLKKLPLDEQHADELFNALQKKYGVLLATVIIQKCTSQKVHETLINHPIKLTYSQLQAIHRKNPSLICVYIEERTKHEGNSNFLNGNTFLTYMAQKDPKMFHNLIQKYKFKITLGRRTTKRYIAFQQNHILTNRETYFNILNTKIFVRKLGAELEDLLFKNNRERDELYWNQILEHYPRTQQFSIYKTMYNLTYYHKFGENIDAIPEEVLKIMPDPIEREKFAKLKLEKEENEDYRKYVTPNNCLNEFMEKINYMTISERAKYVEIATECCVLNEDLDGLLKVLELLCDRFKNDDRKIRESFFYSVITKNKKVFDKFTEQHWNMMMEVIAIAITKNEWICQENVLRINHLKFLIKNKRCIRDALAKYNNWRDLTYDYQLAEHPKLYKILMKELVEMGVRKPDPTIENHAAQHDCILANMCKKYNKLYPEDAIGIYDHPRILQSVKHMLENETSEYVDCDCVSGVEYVICRLNLPKQFVELKDLYFKAFKSFGRLSGVLWFLKNEPTILQNNLNHFLEHFNSLWCYTPTPVWRYIKKYAYLNMNTTTVEFLKSKVTEEGYQHKKKVIKALSILLTPDSYLEYMKAFLPVSTKVDLTDDNTKNLYAVQCGLINLMHHVHSPAKLLPMALELCKGDYLKYALSPLYSCLYNLPEDETKPFIEKLKDNKALSVKKHGMNLTCVLCDVDTVYNCLKDAVVPPLRAALKYFAKNPSDVLWEFIETNISDLEKKDLQVLKFAIDINVPFKYKSKYIEVIWKILDKYENKKLKKSLVKRIDKESLQNLNSEFAFQIIRNSIFKLEEANDLIADVLINLSNNEKFGLFLEILKEFKKKFWNSAEARAACKTLNKFILCLFEKYIKAEEANNKFVEELSASFKSVFSTSEAFEESILISCMAFKGDTVENNSKLLINLNNCVSKEYGHFAVRLVADVIKTEVFAQIYTTSSEQIKLCYSLLKIKESVNDTLLILMLLPEDAPEDTEHFCLYDEILKELNVLNNSLVQLQLNLYLKSGSEENKKFSCDSCCCIELCDNE